MWQELIFFKEEISNMRHNIMSLIDTKVIFNVSEHIYILGGRKTSNQDIGCSRKMVFFPRHIPGLVKILAKFQCATAGKKKGLLKYI